MKGKELKRAIETIELAPELYDRILEPRKPRPHQGLKISMVFVILIFLIGCGSLIWLAQYRVNYQHYTIDLVESVSYACKNDCLKATVDGEELKISEDNAHKLFTYILFATAGRPRYTPPEGDVILLEFGEGATLQLSEVIFKEKKNLFLWYTDSKGETYGYITNKISFSTIRVTYLLDKDNVPWQDTAGGVSNDG